MAVMDEAYRKNEDGSWQQSGQPVQRAYMTDMFNALIEAGEDVMAVRFKRGWIEFDTNEDYERACGWLERQKLEVDIDEYLRG